MKIGKIVKSDSHITYSCQIFAPRETEIVPLPHDYAFGRFVRIAIHAEQSDLLLVDEAFLDEPQQQTYAVGVIYNTILLNPSFGSLGPRLSNETQVELFSPDYISEKAILTSVMILGTMELQTTASGRLEVLSPRQGVPPLSLSLGSEVVTMSEQEVKAFHFFADSPLEEPFLHFGYLPHVITERGGLIQMVVLNIFELLDSLFPEETTVLSIIKENFSWRLKVETTG